MKKSHKNCSHDDDSTVLLQQSSISIEDVAKQPNMTRHDLKDGYVLYPRDWLIVNPKVAINCRFAGVIECSLKSYRMPHLLFFSDKEIGNLTVEDYVEIHRNATIVYPLFRDILDHQITPIDDPDHPGYQLNVNE